MEDHTNDPWDVANIQKAHEERLRETRRWLIAETDAGFEVHEWSADCVAPWSTYSVKESAAARLLQLLHIRHAIAPQAYPEKVFIDRVERDPE
jgi:hypothetical protein